MKRVQRAIEAGQREFGARPFFQRLESTGPLEDVVHFFPDLAFFVFCFQDVLRVNEKRVTDPDLRRIAKHHRREDAHHEQWYLADLVTFGVMKDIGWVFGPEHATTRDTSYELMAEAVTADRDELRIALLLLLEATGTCLFSRIPGYLERAGYTGPVAYFSRRHFEVEQAHELHEAKLLAVLDRIELSPELLERTLAMVGRSFGAMTRMVDAFEANIRQRRQARLVS